MNQSYTTVTGETLASLAERFGVTVAAIKEVNTQVASLTESEDLPVGISLSIPDAQVKSDEPWKAEGVQNRKSAF